MPLKLTIIGSGSAVPTQNRGVTSQYLNFNERHILIDCGEGTQLQLRKFKVKFQRIKYIFISHLHGDHYLGLTGLLSSMSLLGRKQDLTIFCPSELEELLQFQFKIAAVHFNFQIKFTHLKKDGLQLIHEDNSIKAWSFPVKHRIPCWGFKFVEKERDANLNPLMIKKYDLSIEEIKKAKKGEDIMRNALKIKNQELVLAHIEPASYAFSADTKYFDAMAEYVKGVQLLYHEATFTEAHSDRAKATMHSTAKEAATVAKNAGVSKLLLGHFSARYRSSQVLLDEAKPIFENSFCVKDGDEFLV